MKKRLSLLCLTLTACAAQPTKAPHVPAPEPSAKEERSWKDKLGITYVTNSLVCTYKLLAFFADSAAARPIARSSGSDTLSSCVGEENAIH